MERTFEAAALSYVRHGGEARYIGRLIEELGDRLVTTITPVEIREVALKLNEGNGPATVNRNAICPARAIMYHAHEMGWCMAMRIRKFKAPKSRKHLPVDGAWLSAFIRQCEIDNLPHLAGLVLFMNHTAARVSEAVGVLGDHVDMSKKLVVLVKTKTDVMANAYLTDELVLRISNLGMLPGKPVFRYTSRYSVNERIEAVCKRARIPIRSSHSIGRHSFATNAMKLGLDLKTAMEAGRWKSATVFLETYVQPEQSGRHVADMLNRQRYLYF